MWEQIKRVRKPRAAVVLFGSEPFSSLLRVSNLGEYKYDWVWNKPRGHNFQIVRYKPMASYETISVFGAGAVNYYPQMKKKTRPRLSVNAGTTQQMKVSNGNSYRADKKSTHSFPLTSLYFSNEDNARKIHPTQKPVALLRYLIRTYTNAGDTVLDFTMGSGSTGVAAILENRNFIGIDSGYCEKEGLYHGWRWVDVARERIANAANEFVPTAKEKASGQMALFGGDSMT